MRQRKIDSRLLAFLLCFCGLWLATCSAPTTGKLTLDTPAPSFELTTPQGETVTSASLAGEVVVLNFWATWCGPCRMEIPILKELDQEPGVRVVGISLDIGAADEVGAFLAKHQIGYTTLLGNEQVARDYGVAAIPTTVILDRDQNVVRIYRGLVSKRTLRSALDHAKAAG